MPAPQERACPMCGEHGHLPVTSLQRGAVLFRIGRCIACAFVYVVNPSGTTYDGVQMPPETVPEKPRHRQIKQLCDHVLRRGRVQDRSPRIVEVGAGWGGLAQVFARDPGYRYTGYEPSAARAAFGRARGFDVREGLFEAAGQPDAADAVVFDNVLEHVEDPRGLVRDAVASLRPGGLLVVIVPNLYDLRRFHPAWRRRHYWQPHCHINYFARRDLVRLFSRHDMKPRFFGFEAVTGLRDDLALLPRVMADGAGLHLFGLNVYGIRPQRDRAATDAV